jgi:hypothetical protein
MASSPPATPEEFFAESDEALAVYRRVDASIWMHHLEIHTPDDLDDDVRRWLRDAADRAA